MLGLDVVRDAEQLRHEIGLAGPERRGGREPDRPREPRDGRAAVPPVRGRGQAPGQRGARAVRADGCREPARRRPTRGACAAASTSARAWSGRPQVLFLDEPTTGLDPKGRLEMWDVIRELVSDGTTLLLTTQYLEEADNLADTIAVIDGGQRDRRGNLGPAEGSRRRRGAGAAPSPTARTSPRRPSALAGPRVGRPEDGRRRRRSRCRWAPMEPAC